MRNKFLSITTFALLNLTRVTHPLFVNVKLLSILSLAILSFVFFLIILPLPLQAQEQSSDSDGRIIVHTRSGLSFEERQNLHKKIAARQIEEIKDLNLDIVRVERDKVARALEELTRDPRVVYAEPDYKAFALEITNDPGIVNRLQWGMYKVKAADTGISAWYYSKGDGIKIAVLDTGIDPNHEDLGAKIVGSKNCTASNTTDDLYGHGTHVAGIAAAMTNNTKGVAGLGYNATLMNVKVLGDDGSGYYSWIANCIVWSADNGAKVINMSLGGPSKSKTLEDAVNYAWRKGVVVVAAAGNSGNSSPTYPAYYTNAIAVAATDGNDQKASWSSFGRWVDVAAPGASIYSTFPSHPYTLNKGLNYGYASGTSMATPHVAGLAALLWASPYNGSNSTVRGRIESTADKINGTGKYWTYGRINALTAVASNIPSPTPTYVLIPTATPTPTSAPAQNTGSSSLPWWCSRLPAICSRYYK
jgi:thermitase